ncbi:MAG: glycosyltransferase [Thermoanaerobaculia bacterium]
MQSYVGSYVLLVPRLPGTGFTGDRLRAELHLLALREAGYETALVGGIAPGKEPHLPLAASVRSVSLAPSRIPLALARAFLAGDPLQSALFSGDFRAALREAGRADLVVALLLPRLLPHVEGALREAPLVVDFVDALAEAAHQAARHDPAPWRRAYWAVEAPRLAVAEARAARGAAVLLATTPSDAAHLPAGTRAVANGVTLLPPGPAERVPAVAFTGRLMYRPNRLAARRLLRDIWPRVRRAVPDARLLLGGADAPGEVRASEGREGVEIVSPVTDMAAFLRRARVVALPVDLGTGTPNKLFEAFEAGAAVVASAGVIARASSSGARAPARAAATDEEFAREITAYLTDPERAARDGAACRAFAEAHADRRASVAAFAAAYRAAVESA